MDSEENMCNNMTEKEMEKREREAFEERLSIPPGDVDITQEELEELISEGLI